MKWNLLNMRRPRLPNISLWRYHTDIGTLKISNGVVGGTSKFACGRTELPAFKRRRSVGGGDGSGIQNLGRGLPEEERAHEREESGRQIHVGGVLDK